MSNPYGWPVDPIEPLTYITDRLNNRKPFIYLRFNDGEAYSMFGLKKAPETNGEHVYSEAIAKELSNTFLRSAADSTITEDVLVGSWWYEDREHPASMEIVKFLTGQTDGNCHVRWTQQFSTLIRWSRGHIWHREELEREGRCLTDELLRFVDAVKNFKGTKMLVGPLFTQRIANSLWMNHWHVPETNAFESEYVVPQVDLTIWCAGFPAKPWAWNCWMGSDRTSYHIDAGSLFDGLCGRESREWLKRNGSAHSKFYYGEFARYLGIEV